MGSINKKKELEKIEKEILACKICRRSSIGLPVVGEGNPNARVVFIGEAPGKQESLTGRPFIGRSGKYLRQNIKRIGLDDIKDVYITSPVKYLPKLGTPSKQQVAHGRIHFLKQLEVINPKIVVLMGNVSALGALGRSIAVSKLHGQKLLENGKTYFFTYHPAAAIRFFKFRKVFESDFDKLKKLVFL